MTKQAIWSQIVTWIISNNFCFILFPRLLINIIFFGLKNGRQNRSSGNLVPRLTTEHCYPIYWNKSKDIFQHHHTFFWMKQHVLIGLIGFVTSFVNIGNLTNCKVEATRTRIKLNMKEILFKIGKDLLCIKQNSRILCDKKVRIIK